MKSHSHSLSLDQITPSHSLSGSYHTLSLTRSLSLWVAVRAAYLRFLHKVYVVTDIEHFRTKVTKILYEMCFNLLSGNEGYYIA